MPHVLPYVLPLVWGIFFFEARQYRRTRGRGLRGSPAEDPHRRPRRGAAEGVAARNHRVAVTNHRLPDGPSWKSAENWAQIGIRYFIMCWTHILDIEIPWVSESVDIAMFGAMEISTCMDLMITRSSLTFSLQNHSEEKQLYNELLPSGFSLSAEIWRIRDEQPCVTHADTSCDHCDHCDHVMILLAFISFIRLVNVLEWFIALLSSAMVRFRKCLHFYTFKYIRIRVRMRGLRSATRGTVALPVPRSGAFGISAPTHRATGWKLWNPWGNIEDQRKSEKASNILWFWFYHVISTDTLWFLWFLWFLCSRVEDVEWFLGHLMKYQNSDLHGILAMVKQTCSKSERSTSGRNDC